MKNTILISLLALTLFSCSKTLDFDDQGLANQLVLNSIIWPDSSFMASLTKSTSILSDNQIAKGANGTLDLYENGILIRHLSTSTGLFYEPNFKPKAGSTYKVVVNAEGQQIESETTIPAKATILSVDTISTKDQNYGRIMKVTVNIKDQEGDDYYRFMTTSESLVCQYNVDGKGKNAYHLIKNQNNGIISDPIFNSLFNNFGDDMISSGPDNYDLIFPDDYFRNKDYTLNIIDNSLSSYQYQDYYYPDPNNPGMYHGRKTIYVISSIHLIKLSKELFNYMKYLKLYNYYHDDPTAEPVPVFSNINNGAGIFASLNDDAVVSFKKTLVPYSMDTIKIEPSQYY